MSEATRVGLGAAGAALLLGGLADALLRTAPWGVNVGLWVGALLLLAAGLARWQGVPLTGGGRWLAGPALLLAGGVAWRDSAALNALNLLALGGLLALLALRGRAGRLRVGGISTWALAPVVAGLYAAFGPFALAFNAIRWPELPRGRWLRPLLAVGLGLAIAGPLLLIFGGLFAAADATFERVFADLVRWLLRDLAAHVIVTGLAAWAVAGLLYQLFFGRETGDLALAHPGPLGLGPIELGVVLGLLDALFLIFVAIQIPYLFGGAALVLASPGLTYADYARRGFFELVAVAALALPLLLLADWLRRDCKRDDAAATSAAEPLAPALPLTPSPPHRPPAPPLFRALAGGLVVLLLVVMASAMQRMWLYTASYGLTELRLYTTVCMGWLAVVCLWFAVTVLRGRRPIFAGGAMAAAYATLLLLNLANPDALIVQVNAGRTGLAQPFNARYAAGLSADAVPALVAALPVLPAEERRLVTDQLLRRWSRAGEPDWRSWNWGRWLARRTVQGNGPAPRLTGGLHDPTGAAPRAEETPRR